MEILPPTKIKIVEIAGKGRGVVATKKIRKGEIIETCPIMEISETEKKFIEKDSDIIKFYYLIQEDLKRCCLMLGYGSIYNHSENPNADIDYEEDKSQKYLRFIALKDIKPGEEVVYDYEFENNKEEFLKLN